MVSPSAHDELTKRTVRVQIGCVLLEAEFGRMLDHFMSYDQQMINSCNVREHVRGFRYNEFLKRG